MIRYSSAGSQTFFQLRFLGCANTIKCQSEPLACILLSIKFDPFIVTVYLRRGRFGGLSSRDWRIFLLSWRSPTPGGPSVDSPALPCQLVFVVDQQLHLSVTRPAGMIQV
jgi:hypothetical protein